MQSRRDASDPGKTPRMRCPPGPTAVFNDGAKVLWSNRRIRTADTLFGEVRYQAGGFCGPRIQHDVQVVVLHSGTCHVAVDHVGRELPLSWAALFLPKHLEHFTFSSAGQSHHSWCAVAPSAIPAALRHQLMDAPATAPCSEVFNHLHAAAFRLQAPLDGPAGQVLDQLGRCLLLEYLAMASAWESRATPATPVERALRWMEDHLEETDCLKKALHESDVSRNALIYQFRAALNLTPARYLWRLRTERGVAMLGDTGLPVAEISQRCGFANAFHFSRLVRRLQGLPPRQLRERVWHGKACVS